MKSLYIETSKKQAQGPNEAELQKLNEENKNLQNKITTMSELQKTILEDNYSKCTELHLQISSLQNQLKENQMGSIEKDSDYKNLLLSLEKLQQELDLKTKSYESLFIEKAKSDDLLGKMVTLNQNLTQKNRELMQSQSK